jgi:hypothetical protein
MSQSHAYGQGIKMVMNNKKDQQKPESSSYVKIQVTTNLQEKEAHNF